MSSTPFDVQRLVSLGRVTAAAPSPDGAWVAVAVQRNDVEKAKYVSNLWRVPAVGGAPIQLTRGSFDDRAPAFRRDGSLAFIANRPTPGAPPSDDDPKAQVWLLPAIGGEPRPLTDEPLGVGGFEFAAGGNRLVVASMLLPGIPHAEQAEKATELKKKGPSALRFTRMPMRFWDHWMGPAFPHIVAMDEEGGERRDLTPDATLEFAVLTDFDVARDGSWIAVVRAQPGADRVDEHAILVLPCDGSPGRVLGSAPRTSVGNPRISPDGKTIATVRNVRGQGGQGGEHLHLIDVASGEGRDVAREFDAWIVPEGWTEDGHSVVATADWRAAHPVYAIDVATGRVDRITAESDGGTHEGIQVRGDVVYGVRSRLFHPPEPFRVDLRPGSHPRLLACLSGLTEDDARSIATARELEVASDDGARIQTTFVVPAGRTGPGPALLWIHGGPMGAFGDGWHWRWSPLVAASAGYAVALPNPRGSTGFGQAFVDGIWGNVWGAQCYRDCMAVADAMEHAPEVDRERIGAMGGSFGGYMSNWIGVNTDRFRALVTHASVWSCTGFQGVTDHPAWLNVEFEMTPWGNEEAYDLYSPARRAKNWKTPALVIHGERDYRVPISEGLALFEALQAHGVPSEILIFPDENHWILKPRNIVVWYETVLGFLSRHV